MTSITKPETFNASLLSVKDMKEVKGVHMGYVSYNGRKLRLQIPKTRLMYRMSDYKENKKYTAQVSMDSTTDKMTTIVNVINNIDNWCVQSAADNAKDWGMSTKSAKVPADSIRGSLFKSIKVSKEDPPSHEPMMKLNVNKKRDSEEFDIELYDDDNKKLEGVNAQDYLKREAVITAVIELQSVWVNSRKEFGLKWKLVRARIDEPAPESGSSNPFDDMEEKPAAAGGAGVSAPKSTTIADDEEDDLLEDSLPAAGAGAGAPAPKIVHAEEDEEDEDNVVLPPPVPKKDAGVKKTIVKKKTT